MITLCPIKIFSKLEGTKKKELRCSRLRRSHKFGDRGYDDGADVAYP